MDLFLFVMKYTVTTIIDMLLIAMFARAITSWFDPMREGKLSMFLLVLTEPVIFPVRALCEAMHWFENIPLDIPFLITALLLSFLQTLLAFL